MNKKTVVACTRVHATTVGSSHFDATARQASESAVLQPLSEVFESGALAAKNLAVGQLYNCYPRNALQISLREVHRHAFIGLQYPGESFPVFELARDL